MECYLSSELKIRGCGKCMLSLWLKKCILGASERRLVDLANTIHRNNGLTELQREELERTLAENDSWKEAEKSANTGNNVEEEKRYILTALAADEEIDNFEEEVAIIEEIAEVLERRQKDKVPAPRNAQKKKLLEETANVDKVLCKFNTHSMIMTKKFFIIELLLLQIGWE